METLYWGLIIFGILYALITLIFNDVIEHSIEAMFGETDLPFFNPTVLVSGLTTIGAAGILMTRYTALAAVWIIAIAILIAIVVSIGVFFLYIKPMENRENSVGYSMKDLEGTIGEVSISIPAKGYGEVIIRIGIGNTNHIAASWDGIDIPQDTRVVIVETKDNTVYVSPLETDVLS
ncbi:protease [Paenibacillus marinisediminis]